MKRFLAASLALGCLAMSACASTSGTSASTTTSVQVEGGQALLGLLLGADDAVKTLATANETGALSEANCAAVARDAPDALAALEAGVVAYNAADATTLTAQLADATAIVPILTGLAATPASTVTPTSTAKPSTAAEVLALLPSVLTGVADAAEVNAATTPAALATDIPAAEAQLQADVGNFGC